jgi:chromosomal replication initiation ATPase DnaA
MPARPSKPSPLRQLTLRFGHRVAMRAEDFLVSDSNADAVAWIDRWPDWPAPALVVFGPPGCGKTHLVNVWRARSGAPSLLPEALEPDTAGAADPTALLLDGHPHCAIERPAEGLDEHTLLHLYNILREQRGTLLLTAEEPPSRWGVRLPDLRSRLLAAPAVGLGLPDDALIAAVIAKLFADRQIHVRQDVVDYYLRHCERSFAAAREFVTRLDEASLSRGRRITATLARQLFSGSPQDGPGNGTTPPRQPRSS